jgi:hypothetical protein
MSGTGQNENPSSTPPIPLAAVASAASGQMVATTPSRVMNSRRLMADPVDDHKLPHCATQQNWLSMAEMVNRVDFPSPRYFRSPSESGARADMAALTLGATSRLAAEAAAQAIGVEVVAAPLRSAADVESAGGRSRRARSSPSARGASACSWANLPPTQRASHISRPSRLFRNVHHHRF